ncbi:hypothetical protein [Chryseobacterium defluvii]|uniref:Uncharacterized protein n=1 Tax=Chryseobacterium defluvii TaxID=160396 RepID=A0A495SNV3_9FLAO|nr:hypothetical protein [Chryseobacterium defluvii]RKT01961.1 hypothetical protein BCF58_1191 [Chryseobacterium defluvii]
MRLSNRSKVPVYNFVNTLLLMILLGGIVAFFLEEYRFDVLEEESYLLVIVPILLVVVYYLSGRQIFEYDSDGEALNFKNSNAIPFLDKALSDEFPKYKLMKYEVVDLYFVKRLYITISSKNNGSTVLKYEISYLTKKEISDLKVSLNKVIKTNKENKVSENINDNRRIFA